MKLFAQRFETPYGDMLIAVDESGALNRLVLPNEHGRWAAEIVAKQYDMVDDPVHTATVCASVLTQLAEYFAGERRVFKIDLMPHGTPFQLSVWYALQTIPYGHTISYRDLAERIDHPTAMRAVGHANGANPIPIVLPCHRVIGSDGGLAGFGGGLELKAALLSLEGVKVGSQLSFAF